jgi:hypothetical protein
MEPEEGAASVRVAGVVTEIPPDNAAGEALP